MAENEEIAVQDVVCLTADPAKRGVVMSAGSAGGIKKYGVFVDGEIKTYYEGQIFLAPEEKEGGKDKESLLGAKSFLSRIAALHITTPSSGSLYSLNSARIDFVPYQFRPALKIIRADEPRILIADSVGVGKTIEAGLIIKELEARSDLNNIVIVCPKPLVAERKWESEMKRFDEEFVSVDGPGLRQIISDADRDGQWSQRFNRVIIPYSILNERTYGGNEETYSDEKGRKKKRKLSIGLADLDPPPHFDLVIVDEAHRIRNGSMEKQKAFEYKCVKYFCDHADAAVMLTATPLQTGTDNLFVLLNVLRPDVVIDKEVLESMMMPNPFIHRCAKIMRSAGENWQQDAADELKKLTQTQYGKNVTAKNPIFTQTLEALEGRQIASREERVKMIGNVESLHTLNSFFSRTRRKDIEDFCVRHAFAIETSFTARQRTLHDKLLEFERKALEKIHGDSQAIQFMMTTIKRQAASCIFALAPYIDDFINRRFDQIQEDAAYYEGEDFSSVSEDSLEILRTLAQELISLSKNLPAEDPKFDGMMTAIREKQKEENNKIIVFSSFKHTLSYLLAKLKKEGLRVAQIDGSVKDEARLSLRERFSLSKGDESTLDILLFSEVGSEGLDYQFCDMMINYDLPWNPMRIEQRIGRIDRRGQKSEVVTICNLVTKDTIDADIYHRCFERIGIFESSIGECDEILGEMEAQIEKIASNHALSDEEKRKKLEQMSDNEVRKLQELEKLESEQKEFFGVDLSEAITKEEIKRAENPWISPKSVQNLIEQYLASRLGEGHYISKGTDVKSIRLSRESKLTIREDFFKLPNVQNAARQSWLAYLKSADATQKITFEQSIAEKNRDAFFISSSHPLARQAAMHFSPSRSQSGKTQRVALSARSDTVKAGVWRFSLYAWTYSGSKPHIKTVAVCGDEEMEKAIPLLLQDAQDAEGDSLPPDSNSEWERHEERHAALWRLEKERYLLEVEGDAAFKIESLTNSFSRKKRSLERKIEDCRASEKPEKRKIAKMYEGELKNTEQRYLEKTEAIRERVCQSDIHTALIANGVLCVEN